MGYYAVIKPMIRVHGPFVFYNGHISRLFLHFVWLSSDMGLGPNTNRPVP